MGARQALMPEALGYICRGETAVCLGDLQLAFIKVCLCVPISAWLVLLSYVYSVPGHIAFLTLVLLLVLQNGFAIIRPPGHHAEESTAM